MSTLWSASAGDDDPHAETFESVTDAENAAQIRSTKTFHHTAYVRRAGGQRIRQYENGSLCGYLNGSEIWVNC